MNADDGPKSRRFFQTKSSLLCICVIHAHGRAKKPSELFVCLQLGRFCWVYECVCFSPQWIPLFVCLFSFKASHSGCSCVACNNTRRNKFENNGYKWPKTEEFPKVKYIASKLHFWFHLNIAHAHATACQFLVSSLTSRTFGSSSMSSRMICLVNLGDRNAVGILIHTYVAFIRWYDKIKVKCIKGNSYHFVGNNWFLVCVHGCYTQANELVRRRRRRRRWHTISTR